MMQNLVGIWPVGARSYAWKAEGRGRHMNQAARLLTCARAVPPDANEWEDVGGNQELQEMLLDELRQRIHTQTLKEEIKDDLKGRVEEIRQLGEELQQQLAEDLEIEKFRTELQSNEALRDTMRQFDELEEEIEALKRGLAEDRADLAAWEQQANAARSKGLFFQSLYPSGAGPDRQSAGAVKHSTLDVEHAAAVTQPVKVPAEREVASPLRLWLFTYMSSVLGLVAAQDAMSPAPSWPQDSLYVVLALILGVNAYNERMAAASHLAASRQQAAPRLDAQAQGSGERNQKKAR